MSEREKNLYRLANAELNVLNQHYIINYFLFKDIEQALQQFATGKALDLGCGNKPYRELFTFPVTEYIGCDIIQSSGNRVDVICPATALNFDDGIFDTVFSTQVIEHVDDHQKMLSETNRVLKNNGHAIFTIPFNWELHEEPFDFFRFSKYGIEYLFKKHGFEVLKIKSNGGKWASIFQLFLNTLFSTRKYRTFRSILIKHLFITFRFMYVYNKIAVWLDKKYFDDILTLNYLVVAKKVHE